MRKLIAQFFRLLERQFEIEILASVRPLDECYDESCRGSWSFEFGENMPSSSDFAEMRTNSSVFLVDFHVASSSFLKPGKKRTPTVGTIAGRHTMPQCRHA